MALIVSLGMTAGAGSGTGDMRPTLEIILGEAYDLGGGAERYREEHQESFLEGRLVRMRTLYRDAAGSPIAERDLDFTASGNSSARPAYSLRDLRSGGWEGGYIEQGLVRLHYRASRTAPLREKSIRVPEPVVIDGGFHFFLRENWDVLMAGKKVSFNFVVPSRLDYFRFVAYLDPASGTPAEGRKAGERIIVAIPENRLLRLVVEPIVARYDAGSRRMLEYRGLSNLGDAAGQSQKVRLVYREPGL